jgi:hypothetical protein
MEDLELRRKTGLEARIVAEGSVLARLPLPPFLPLGEGPQSDAAHLGFEVELRRAA